MNYDHENSIEIADLNMINKSSVADEPGTQPGRFPIRNRGGGTSSCVVSFRKSR